MFIPNQLYGEVCQEPALIDNDDTLTNTFTVFGDYPFMP